jgi:hypothetical protein
MKSKEKANPKKTSRNALDARKENLDMEPVKTTWERKGKK